MTTDQICEAFYLIVVRMAREYGEPLPKRLLEIGDKDRGWHVALNPTNEPVDDLQPFSASVSWNGWPAGLIDPRGGIIAAGELANEETFREWLNQREAVA